MEACEPSSSPPKSGPPTALERASSVLAAELGRRPQVEARLRAALECLVSLVFGCKCQQAERGESSVCLLARAPVPARPCWLAYVTAFKASRP